MDQNLTVFMHSTQTIFLSLLLYGYGSSFWYGYSRTEPGMWQCDEFNLW